MGHALPGPATPWSVVHLPQFLPSTHDNNPSFSQPVLPVTGEDSGGELTDAGGRGDVNTRSRSMTGTQRAM